MNAHPDVCVIYLLRDVGVARQVLLGQKRRGLGTGKWVAPGGKIHPGERVVDAAVRELAEETGIALLEADLVLTGHIDYRFPHRSEWSQRSSVFVAHCDAEPSPSAEIDAQWIDCSQLPLDAMWSDARWWLPRLLRGEHVVASFTFAEDNDSVAEASTSFTR